MEASNERGYNTDNIVHSVADREADDQSILSVNLSKIF
jgi:hypothetical protein